MEKKVEGAMAMDGERHKVGRRRASSKTDPQRKDPWLTPTESCASDESRQDEDKPTRAPTARWRREETRLEA